MARKTITFVTGNPGKLAEFKSIMGENFPHDLICEDIDQPEYQGEPDEVSRLKCEDAYRLLKRPVLVEDVSLCFNALGGMPGLHRLLAGFEDKTASAICIFAYHSGEEGAEVEMFTGQTEGTIVAPRGTGGFGWDPVFLPTGFSKTYGQMSESEKNEISHRRKALNLVRDYFIQP